MELEGRAAIVVGEARIGHTAAVTLAARGVDVALALRGPAADVERTADAVRGFGRRAVRPTGDLARSADRQAVLDESARALGRLDIVVHVCPLLREDAADVGEGPWEQGVSDQLKAILFSSRAALPHLRAAGGGRIVTIAGWTRDAGDPGSRRFVPGHVARAGVIALTEALALETAADQVLVNAIVPEASGATGGERADGTAAIAGALLLLVGADFVTGETIRVPGASE
jgi:NAD(P)-dependent dehydrogenase (short-subunit alcohol dehydrogenase family)